MLLSLMVRSSSGSSDAKGECIFRWFVFASKLREIDDRIFSHNVLRGELKSVGIWSLYFTIYIPRRVQCATG